MDENCFDIVVVGAGPAGLSAARRAAESGAIVQVYERNSEVGWPVRSSGGTFVRDMRELGVPDRLCHPISRIRILSQSKQAVFEYEDPEYCILDVRGLCQYLAEEASKAGATARVGSTVLSAITRGKAIVGVVVEDGLGHKREVNSSLVIDASGHDAVIARAAKLHAGFKRRGIGVEYEMVAPEYDQNEVLLLCGSALAPHGYGWAFPRGGSRVGVGVGLIYPDFKGDPTYYVEKAVGFIQKRLGTSKRWSILGIHKGTVPSQEPAAKSVGPGIIAVGDSAGQALCTTGEGIRFAMRLGEAAGRSGAKAVADPLSADSILRNYQNEWQTQYGRTYKAAYLINEKLAQVPDKKWDKYVDLASGLTPDQLARALRGDFKSLLFSLPSLPNGVMSEMVKLGIRTLFNPLRR